MTVRIPNRRSLIPLVLAGCGLMPTGAAATDGNLYLQGPSIMAVASPFTSTPRGTAYEIRVPLVNSISIGNKWEMNWGCPVPGSEIAQVDFGASRYADPSSLAIRVTGNRQVLWELPDKDLPLPANGRQYSVPLPGGQCNVHLALFQSEDRRQYERVWFIDYPRVLVRDLTAPSAAVRHLSAGWFNANARPLEIGWSVGDNFGSDGVGLQQIHLAGRRLGSGSPGVGDHAISADIGALEDGVHQLVVSVAGDGTGGATATGTVLVDRTPPRVSTAPPGHSGALRTVNLTWGATDATSGVASTRVEVAQGDGWVTLAEGSVEAQDRAVSVPANVADGAHAWRVVASDHAGNARTETGAGAVIVDTTPPSLALTAPQGWTTTAALTARIDDNLAHELGLGDVDVEVNAADGGRDDGPWVRVLSTRPEPGSTPLTPDVSALADGEHLLRVRAHNGAPFSERLVTQQTALLRLDRSGPRVGAVAFTPGTDGTLRATWTANDPHSGVARAAVQWSDNGVWRTLGQGEAGEGADGLTVAATPLGRGGRTLRVVVSDHAGNETAAEGVVTVDRAGAVTGAGVEEPSGLGSTAGDPWSALRAARLDVAVPGARVGHSAGGGTPLTPPPPPGARVGVRARVRPAAGPVPAAAQLEIRGFRGVVLGRGRTDRTGRARMVVRPQAGGPLHIGVPAGGRLLPVRARQDVRLQVRARVVLRRTHAAVRTGDTVLFSGRVHPAPGRLGMGGRKGMVLEWRDPLRGVWRPVVNARVRPNGTFSVPWRFALRGIAVPLRARVPAEIGWPLLPAVSGRMVVTPR